jgi:hypothetical protein
VCAADDCPDAGTFIDTDVPRYAQVLDQNRLDAMKKLAELKKSANQEVASATAMKPSRDAAVELFDSRRGFSQAQIQNDPKRLSASTDQL